jgi:5-methylcytosine-specific restriction endonuclease McrA
MIDYHALKFGKGLPRIVVKMAKARIQATHEQKIRLDIGARDRRRCCVPGCRRLSTDLHHIRPRSLGGLFESRNLSSVCRLHHQWITAGLLRVSGNPNSKKGVKVSVTSLGRHAGLRIWKIA